MEPRERLIATIERKPIKGLVPHFELAFYLTIEAFGKVHPAQRKYNQWNQMSDEERQLHRNEIADIHIMIAEKYNHCAIFIQPDPGIFPSNSYEEETLRIIELIREKTGNKYFLLMHGDATYAIPDGENLEKFIYRISDDPDKVKEDADFAVNNALSFAERISKHGGLDGFALCSDYCFNDGPFLSPSMFSGFITPYLAKLTKGYKELGYYVLKHTDGNIMPILDQIVQTEPHILHSIDPQAGVDLAVVKKLVGDKVCLMGNVNCGLMQTGTEEEAAQSVRYALENGMPGGGYIFSTSNCIYTGMSLKRYEMMLEIWKNEGIY
jgi:uroporphyrinogen decarboxylase